MGFYDYTGKVVLNTDWDKLVPCEKGILVTKSNMQGFFSYDGNPILNCCWKRLEPHSQAILAYIGEGARKVLYNYDGTIKK